MENNDNKAEVKNYWGELNDPIELTKTNLSKFVHTMPDGTVGYRTTHAICIDGTIRQVFDVNGPFLLEIPDNMPD